MQSTNSLYKTHASPPTHEHAQENKASKIAYKCGPMVVKSLISFFNLPLIFLHTFFPGDPPSSDSSSELSDSATNISTQPSGRGSTLVRAESTGLIFLLCVFGMGLSDVERDGGPGRGADEEAAAGGMD